MIRPEKALSGAAFAELTSNGFRALKTLGQAEMTFSEWHEASRLGDSSFKRARTELIGHGLVSQPPNGRGTKGYKYALTQRGEEELGVQSGGGPNAAGDVAEKSEVHGEVQPESLAPQQESNGSTTGPDEVQDPWAWLGPFGGAYRAPHEPKAEIGSKEKI